MVASGDVHSNSQTPILTATQASAGALRRRRVARWQPGIAPHLIPVVPAMVPPIIRTVVAMTVAIGPVRIITVVAIAVPRSPEPELYARCIEVDALRRRRGCGTQPDRADEAERDQRLC